MAHFGLKIPKSQSPDKTPYTVYYPHSIPVDQRRWTQSYYQFCSIDPAGKNYALRIERRYHNGWITPVVFDKMTVQASSWAGDTLVCDTYQVLTSFLDRYVEFYKDCHFIVIERQLPQNYKATRIAQHTISYFSMRLHNNPLLPAVIEVDPKLKGKLLGAPKGISDKQLKAWAVEKARELLNIRKDQFSLGVMTHFRNKQDDLADVVCQIEALIICWGLPITGPPPPGPDETPQTIKAITLQLTPPMVVDPLTMVASVINSTSLITSKTEVPIPHAKIQPRMSLQLTPTKEKVSNKPLTLNIINNTGTR